MSLTHKSLGALAASLANLPIESNLKICAPSSTQYLEIRTEGPDYRVVYTIVPWPASPSVPVLYFSVYDGDGVPVVDVAKVHALLVPQVYKESMAGVISQGEHPLFGLPAFFIHPCNTASFTAVLATDGGKQPDDPSLLLLWFDTFGQMVGLPGRQQDKNTA